MRALLAVLVLAALGLAGPGLAALAQDGPADRPDVLLICIDDLRPELGCMGGLAQTPNLDRLAAGGRLFERHYVQVPTCGASRRCLLSGCRPSERKHLGNGACVGLGAGSEGAPTLPALFRAAGWRTAAIGKISHEPDGYRGNDPEGREPELHGAWDEILLPDWPWGRGHLGFFGYADHSSRERGVSPPMEFEGEGDLAYPDGWIARAAAKRWKQEREQPLFLAVGFYKPHLPFTAPKAYLDAVPADLPLAPYGSSPAGLEHDLDAHGSGEFLGNYGTHPEGRPLPEDYRRQVRRAYMAAVAYVDAQVGLVLQALEDSGRRDSTIVALWSDHGWHLGDHGVWGKHTPLERSLRSPLILRVPKVQGDPGRPSQALVESIDLYPTLAELAGIPVPAGIDGQSFAASIASPDAPGRPHTRGWWRRSGWHAVTLRSPTHRLVRWSKDGTASQVELFDHRSDPGETTSVHASQPAVLDELLEALDSAQLDLR